MMDMKRHLFILALALPPAALLAQVSGTVKDEASQPLVGAHVRWINAKEGVVADEEGKFRLPQRGSKSGKIVASYVGYRNDTVEVGASPSALEIVLRENLSLGEATARAQRAGTYKSISTVENVDLITTAELCRAACCNLGESFVANPSVDVSYSDAATGAKQIRLLGLSGTYVQMLTENIPNFRGVAAPYGLGYVPGPWMQGIQVSKGASSVKNGYESITGQINVEYKKPQQPNPDLLALNAYADIDGRVEGNADATFKVGKRWGTTLLGHYEKDTRMHDEGGDGFADMPQVEQYNFVNRWTYSGDNYLLQFGGKLIKEDRRSGQVDHKMPLHGDRYAIDIATDRYEGFAKQAYIFNKEKNTNLALILSGSWHHQDASYGLRRYDVKQTNAYASLMFETEFSKLHSLSTGASLNYDRSDRKYRLEHDASLPLRSGADDEATPGLYAQYTFNLRDKLVVMAGLRGDHSSIYGFFFTPRIHLKYTPGPFANFRLSAGKGYRTARVMDENNYLFSGSRRVEAASALGREEAWNYGVSAAFKIPAGDRPVTLNLEYYYTDFLKQVVADMDADPHAVRFYPLSGSSYSQVVQAELSYMLFSGFTATAAYRYTDARSTYGGRLREKPLTNRYKALLTLSYKTPLELWQFDATLQLNGGGRMPDPYRLADGTWSWSRRFGSYPQLSAQVTRYFRQFSVYVGGENLTNFRQKNPIIDAANPWGDRFDPTMVWGPMHGVKAYVGARFNLPAK